MKSQQNFCPTEIFLALNQLNLSLQNINKTLEKKFGLSLAQWSLLKCLMDKPAVSPYILAQTLHITPGSLSQSLARLEKKNYLFMGADPGDARKKMVSITRSGKNAVSKAKMEFTNFFTEIEVIQKPIFDIQTYLTNPRLKFGRSYFQNLSSDNSIF